MVPVSENALPNETKKLCEVIVLSEKPTHFILSNNILKLKVAKKSF